MLPIIEVTSNDGRYYVKKGDRGTWVATLRSATNGGTLVVMARHVDGEIRTVPDNLVKVIGWRTANIGL